MILRLIITLIAGVMEAYDDPVVSSPFPSELGTRWVYAVQSLHGYRHESRDTLEITIVDSFRLANTVTGRIWLCRYLEKVDTLRYVESVSLTTPRQIAVKVFTPGWGEIATFLCPLEEGEQWDHGTKVAGREDAQTPVGWFGDCFLIQQEDESGGRFLGFSCWVKPGVGIVKFSRYHIEQHVWVPFRESWELISFEVP